MNEPRAMAPSSVARTTDRSGTDDDPRRRELIGRLSEDREELMRAAGAVREKLAVAQDSLAFVRRGVRWVLVFGGLAALAVSIRNGRRPPLLLTGLSLYLLQRWLSSRRAPQAATTRPALGDARKREAVRIYRLDGMATPRAASSRVP